MEKTQVLALDYGKKRIGIASGNTRDRLAFPRIVIENKSRNFLLDRISKMVNMEDIGIVVVGLPLGSEIVDEVEGFVEFLKKNLTVTVKLMDETLSSFEAEELMKSMGKSYFDDRGMKDTLAAQVILQRFFDSL